MALNKRGSPTKLKVVKQSGFVINVNYLSEMLLKQWPDKKISVDQLHSALKSIGIDNYSSEDMSELMNRLQAVGFSISK
jgi:hypothetical protein